MASIDDLSQQQDTQSPHPTPGAFYGYVGELNRRVTSCWSLTPAPREFMMIGSAIIETGAPSSDNNNNNSDDPIARPIKDEYIVNVGEIAEPVNPQEAATKITARRRKHLVQIVIASALVLAVVVVVVVVVILLVTLLFSDGSSSSSSSSSSSEYSNDGPNTTSQSLETRFKAQLPNYTLNAIQTDPQSPQAKAYSWLVQDTWWRMDNEYALFRSLQRFALATFYFATENNSWYQNQGWLNHTLHECDWAFVPPPNSSELLWLYNKAFMEKAVSISSPCALDYYTNQTDETYRYLWLAGNNIQGSLPAELFFLTSLSSIVLSSNQLRGTLPTQLGQLSQLQELWLFRNKFTGTIPVEMKRMSNLTSLLASVNSFTGTVPTFFGSMTNLKILRLSTSALSGTIPTELASLHENLVELYLMENRLTGTLPTELGKLTNAEFLLFGGNALQGTIPTELAQIQRLKWILLRFNQLTGPIPSEFGKLSQLQMMGLYDNQLTGTIPLELARASNMVLADLGENLLTGIFPGDELAIAWSKLEGISLAGNVELIGTVPAAFCNLSHPWTRGSLLNNNCSTAMLCGCDCPCE